VKEPIESLGRIGALGCVLLVVLATVPPVSGGSGQGSALTGVAAAGNVPSGTPVELKNEAATAVGGIDVEDEQHQSARDRAYDRLNGTLDEYRDPVRVASMSAFTDDAVALQALSNLANTNGSTTAVRASHYVATGGRHSGYISGVAVQFITENGTVVSEIPVGNITQFGERHWVNTTIPTVPAYVVPKVEDWETPDSEFDEIRGTYITAEGEFQPYELSDPANFTR